MSLSTEAWIWLAASLVAAPIIDILVTRMLLEMLKPASAYVFWAGRAGKLTAIVLWIAFFAAFWHPRFMWNGETPQWLKFTAIGIGLAAFIAAFVTLPRAPQRGSGNA